MSPKLPAPSEAAETARQREILLAAIQLFHEHGFHATGMNDIGAAVGLTGPALYRHFASKEDILETALMNASRYMERKVQPVVHGALDPCGTLQRLVHDLVQVVVDYPAVVAIARTERRFMSPRALTIYDRSTRLRETEWIGPLLQVRPELSESEGRLRVQAAQNLLAATVVGSPSLPAPAMAATLESAAMAILTDPGGRALPPLPIDEESADVDDVA